MEQSATLPGCVVIIPDGNRRSAKVHRRVAISAHHYGLENARVIIDAAFQRGVKHVVFWAASVANLRDRSPTEVGQIFRLFKDEVRRRLEKTDEGRFKVCGSWRDFNTDHDLSSMVDELERKTASFEGLEHQKFTLLVGYDGRDDIIHGVRRIIEAGLKPEDVTEQTFPLYLMSKGVPNVDLLIRTGEESGKPHWSKALLPWQMYDPELYFTPTLWPDFKVEEFDEVLNSWSSRRRLNGK